MLVTAIVAFCLCVLFFWCGVSVVQFVRVGEAQLKRTLKGKLMLRTAYGTIAVSVMVIAAFVARQLVGMLGV